MSRSRLLAPTALLCAVLTSLFAMAASDDSVSTGSTWLDAKPLPSWNTSGARLPKALPGDGQSLRTGRCAQFARKPTTASDRALMKAGWTLLGPLQFDGAMGEVRLYSPRNLTATVRRYAADDPLCCPSRQGSVQYELQPGPKGPVVTATQATTSPTPPQ
ncbi:hypothetical protein [Myxococcus sp. CA040A]|uniref:hypothetical protein n=1 Tax=Myxococcus sp. CA040A TaxID=2741738 RepID=UPI00157B4889|nr:hypothetical protein [Myxococcus sp. CA040A]NTX04088.1 hypothetical protein [Myxococcus sp. CA040A]